MTDGDAESLTITPYSHISTKCNVQIHVSLAEPSSGKDACLCAVVVLKPQPYPAAVIGFATYKASNTDLPPTVFATHPGMPARHRLCRPLSDQFKELLPSRILRKLMLHVCLKIQNWKLKFLILIVPMA